MYKLSIVVLTVVCICLANGQQDLTERIITILRDGSDGIPGVLLKEIDIGVLAAYNENFEFYPQSSIKVLHHLYTMLQVQEGKMQLTDPMRVTLFDENCEPNTAPFEESVRQVLSLMMQVSDNDRTNVLQFLFGPEVLNDYAESIGMGLRPLHHGFNCGNVANDPPNVVTLEALSVLYERVVKGEILNGETRELFFDIMHHEGQDISAVWNSVDAVITLEASTIDGLSPEAIAKYRQTVRLAHKNGSVTAADGTNNRYVCVSGYASLPFCSLAVEFQRNFVFGLSVANSTQVIPDEVYENGRREVLRDLIREGLTSFVNC